MYVNDLIVIGGGAAGLMATIQAAESGLNVLLLEKGFKLGRKILISGGGRCNVTNNKYSSIRDFLINYPRGSKFLWGPLSRFSNSDLINWFESKGLKLKTEEDGRVFPITDNSQSVLDVLVNAASKAQAQIEVNKNVCRIEKENDLFHIYLQNEESYLSKNVLIACGGMSYQVTGSSGDAYEWAKYFGHKVIQPKPSLMGYLSPAKWVHALKGLTLTEVDLQLFYAQSLNDFDSLNDKKYNQNINHKSILIAKQKGALLFTHWGISGPGVFKITSLAAGTNYAEGIFILKINLLPNIKKEELREVLKEKWKASPKRKVINAIEGLIPARLEEYIVSSMLWNPEKTYGEISNTELDQLIQYITALEIPINGIRPSGEEVVTAGGIDLNEIDSKTMQSKIVSGLYFAGEVIDIDGFTGGFNLQASWSTGWVAGNSIQV